MNINSKVNANVLFKMLALFPLFPDLKREKSVSLIRCLKKAQKSLKNLLTFSHQRGILLLADKKDIKLTKNNLKIIKKVVDKCRTLR